MNSELSFLVVGLTLALGFVLVTLRFVVDSHWLTLAAFLCFLGVVVWCERRRRTG